jgi:hypothetical protein
LKGTASLQTFDGTAWLGEKISEFNFTAFLSSLPNHQWDAEHRNAPLPHILCNLHPIVAAMK